MRLVSSSCISRRKGGYTRPVRFVASGVQGEEKGDENDSEEEVSNLKCSPSLS